MSFQFRSLSHKHFTGKKQEITRKEVHISFLKWFKFSNGSQLEKQWKILKEVYIYLVCILDLLLSFCKTCKCQTKKLKCCVKCLSVKFKSHWWLSSGWNIKCWINYISSGCGGEGRKMSIFISFSCNPLNLFWSCWLSSGLDLNPSRGFNQMCNQTKWMYCIWFDPILFYLSIQN